MSAVYTAGVNAFLAGQINALTDTIQAGLITDDTFAYDDSHTLVSDVAGIIAYDVIVSVDHIADGAIYLDPVTFVGVPASPDSVTGLLFWVAGVGTLLCHIDRKADTVNIDIEPDGGNLIFTFNRLLKL